MTNIAVIVAHPDDEVLAFGGLIAKRSAAGDVVSILILATGITSRSVNSAEADAGMQELQVQAQEAGRILGASKVDVLDFPDNRMDTVALLDIVKRIEVFLRETGASEVYTHHDADLNIDHTICSKAVLTASRFLPGGTVRRILSGEVLSSSEFASCEHRFTPNSYLEISKFLHLKCQALSCYKGELRDWPHPRSLESVRHLAHLRGSEVGVEAAEAYRVIRELCD